jgi:hypothetical protein
MIGFFGLVAVTALLWNHAHEPWPTGHAVRLAESGPVLAAGDGALRLPLGSFPKADGIQLRWDLRADALEPGPEIWQDGRLALEWYRGDRRIERVFLASVSGSQHATHTSCILSHRPGPTATAVLRLENHGTSGDLQLVGFEAAATRALPGMQLGLILAGAGWVVWLVHLVASPQDPRAWLAALLWVGFAFFLILPGPWPMRSALFGNFSEPPSSHFTQTLVAADFDPCPSKIDLQPPANPLLRWKFQLEALRPVLHALLFFVPALALMLAAGQGSRGALLAAILAATGELSQWAMGFGFDATDGLDLLADASGIALAWIAYRVVPRPRFLGGRRRQPAHS